MDEGGAEPKPVRWAKGKKKRATVHAHVEAHIPMVLAPTTPRLMAADLSNTKIWDEEQLQKLRQNWAWVNGVPEYPSTGKLEYLKVARKSWNRQRKTGHGQEGTERTEETDD